MEMRTMQLRHRNTPEGRLHVPMPLRLLLFRCYIGCDCECPENCHYEPDEESGQGTEDASDAEEERGKAVRSKSDEREETKQDDDGDEAMQQAREPRPEMWSLGKLFEKLSGFLNSEMHDDDSYQAAGPYAKAYFGKLYAEAIQNGMRPKTGTNLPDLTEQQELQLDLMSVLVVKQVPLQKFTAAVMDVVRTSFRSTWSVERILRDSCKSAIAPPAEGPNAWGKKTPNASQYKLAEDMNAFRFDRSVFSEDQIIRFRKLCQEQHPFAIGTRKVAGEEWEIMLGIMSGAIAIRTIPEFLKRCCNLMQFQWLNYQISVRAEGELYAKLPEHAKVFDFNQTSKRLSDTILAAVEYQKADDRPVREMLAAAKSLAYNAELKSIHIFFDTKAEAVRWESMTLPFRNFKVQLQNPDARYREVQVTTEGERKIIIRPPRDGLQDDRYEVSYKLLMGNVTRTMELDKFAKFLDDLTGGAIKLGAPVDSYGAKSVHSLTWIFIAHTSECMPALQGVNQILWKGHANTITHPGKPSPCHKCGDIGHQMSACPKTNPEDWISASTIEVSAAAGAAIQTMRKQWTTPEEAKRIFEALGDPTVLSAPTEALSENTEKVSTGPAPAGSCQETPANTSVNGTATVPTEQKGNLNDGPPPAGTTHEEADTRNGPTSSGRTVRDPNTNITTPTHEQPGNNSTVGPQTTKEREEWFTAMSRIARNKAKQRRSKDSTTSPNDATEQNGNGQSLPEGKQNDQSGTIANKDAANLGKSNRRNHRRANNQRNTEGRYNDGNEHNKDEGEDNSYDENASEDAENSDSDDQHEGQRRGDDDAASNEKDEEINGDTNTDYHEHTHDEEMKTADPNDDESVTMDQGQTPAENGPHGHRTSRDRRSHKQRLLPHRVDDDELEAAIERSNMERIGMTIHRLADRHRPQLHKAAVLAALGKARADTTRRHSSRKGTIEAIHGTHIATPPTGNCLYAAVAESLLQLAFAANKNHEELLEVVMLLKFVLYLANRVDTDVEFNQSNVLALMEVPVENADELTKEQLMAKIADFYAQVATSSSELNHVLPEALWGRTDCIRLLAKALRRSIYVIMASGDQDVVHHMVFQPQRIKDHQTKTTVPSAAITQPGYQEWLHSIQQEVEAGITPIVLSHANEHYNAVLFHHDAELTQRKVPTKETTLTKLWGPAQVAKATNGEQATNGRNTTAAAEDGMTMTEMINSQSSVHPQEVFRALSQENWSRAEKKAAIDALVHGRDRIKELLTFCEANGATGTSTTGGDEDDEMTEGGTQDDSDGLYVPSSGSSADSQPVTRQTGDEDDSMEDSPQQQVADAYTEYTLPHPPKGTVYGEWAQQQWERIVDEWAGQDGIQPPRLDNRSKLATFAAKYPEVMTELGRAHPNPVIVMEHFLDTGLRGWCGAKRIRYCVDELTHVIAAIDDAAVRTVLTEWKIDVSAGTNTTIQTQKYRDQAKWDLLRTHAADLLATRPLLTRDFTKECLCVLLLDDLFPNLASDILRTTGIECDETVDLGMAYQSVPKFAEVIKQTKDLKRWEPTVEYIRSLGIHLSQPGVTDRGQY